MPHGSPTNLLQWTVDDALAAAPAAAVVLSRLGIDTCCGGCQTLAEAARSVGIAPEALVARFAAILDGAT